MTTHITSILIFTLLISLIASQNLNTETNQEIQPSLEETLLARITSSYPEFQGVGAVQAVALPNPPKFESRRPPPERYAFTFTRQNDTIKTIVSLLSSNSTNQPQERLVLSPFIVIRGQFLDLRGHNMPEWINTTDFQTAYTSSVSDSPTTTAIIPGILGGFDAFPDRNDQRLQLALTYLQNRHPLLLTYSLQQTRFQIVAGTNVWLRFRSPNALSIIEAIVFVDLGFTPALIEFHSTLITSQQLQDSLSFHLYRIQESMLTFFDDMAQFNPTSTQIDEQFQGKRFISLTYDHQVQQIRTLVDVQTDGQSLEVFSKYSFQYASE